MGCAFARRQVVFDAVGKKREAHLVLVLHGAESKHRGNLRRTFALRVFLAAVVAGAADIHAQHHRQFAFLDILADKRIVHARGDVPVDETNVVPGLVLAKIIKLDALALEAGMVLPA